MQITIICAKEVAVLNARFNPILASLSNPTLVIRFGDGR